MQKNHYARTVRIFSFGNTPVSIRPVWTHLFQQLILIDR